MATERRDLQQLIGQQLVAVTNESDERIVFTLADGRQYGLWHDQDCCESVRVEEVWGDLGRLAGTVLFADEVTHDGSGGDGYGDTATWTFYRIATEREFVTIRWYGTSNGYYSERVTFGPLQEVA